MAQTRSKKCWVLGLWKFMPLFGGVLGRREIAGFFRGRLGLLKLSNFIFWEYCIVGVKFSTMVNFLGFYG